MENITVNIDEIMDMLDWNNPPEVQEGGRVLARKVRCINVFLQPGHPGHVKKCLGQLRSDPFGAVRPRIAAIFISSFFVAKGYDLSGRGMHFREIDAVQTR